MSVMLQNQIILLPELSLLGTHQVPLLVHPSLLRVDVVDAGSSVRLLVVAVARVIAADGNTVGSGYRWPRPIHRIREGRCCRLILAYGQLAM